MLDREESLAVEMSLIGAVIMDDESRSEVLSIVSVGMLLDIRCQEILAAINDMAVDGEKIDLVTLANKLRHRGKLEAAGGAVFLAEVVSQCPSTTGSMEYARILRENHDRRRLIGALHTVAHRLETGEEEKADPGIVYDRVMKLSGMSETERLVYRMRELLDGFDPEQHKPKDGGKGYPETGMADIDRAMAIFKPGCFTVLAARPGVGKSTLMRQMAVPASRMGPVLIFTLEESKEQVRDKMLCSMSNVDYSRWFRGMSAQEDDLKLVEIAGDLAGLPILFYGGYRCDVARVKLVLRTLSDRNERPTAVFIDHLQLMAHPKAENRDQAVGETTRELRLMSLEFNVPIILLCQMNRQIDQRPEKDRKPRLSDLRESGNIEANAPCVIFLWRENTEDNNEITFTLAKHRDGPTTEFPLVFLKAYGKFTCKVKAYGNGERR
jgi:replicative DNA helicase